jgi:NAD(P)-dependent dehydrogenase (short-subunit alcohol dehydrogenase family)
MGRLDGRVAIITGAARGIGEAAARLFVHEGARVVLADRLGAPLQRLAAELGGQATAMPTDVSDEASVQALVDHTITRFGRIDVALLNAGIAGESHNIVDYPTALFDQIIAVNVRGIWLGLKSVMRAMNATGGSIVVTASTASIRATPNMSAYIASKHAVLGLMRAAAIDGAAKGIRVNSVNPATIETPMVAELAARVRLGGGEHRQAPHIPMGRTGQPEEVARMMLYLASDDASFCTGGAYMVDGGVSAGRAG